MMDLINSETYHQNQKHRQHYSAVFIQLTKTENEIEK